MHVEFYTETKRYGRHTLANVASVSAKIDELRRQHHELKNTELQYRVLGGMGLVLKDETTALQLALRNLRV